MSRRMGLEVILVLFVCFCAAFAWMTPYRTAGIVRTQGGSFAKDIGAPDERQHANYVMRLMEGKGFAVLDPKDPELYENYQAHQPPAYYLVAAGWSKALGADLTTRDGGIKLRALSILIGLGTVAGLWFFIFWGTGSREAASAGAAFALMPMFVALHGAISNDPLLFLSMSWSMAFLARLMRFGGTWRDALILGGLVGLAFLTKTTSLALIPVALLAGVLGRNHGPAIWKNLAIALGISLVLGGMWWARNQSLYGDPFALKVFKDSFGGSMQAADMTAMVGGPLEYWTHWVGWWTLRSFVAAFGYMDIYLFQSLGQEKFNQIYLAILVLLGGVFGSGIYAAFTAKPEILSGSEDDTPANPRDFGLLCLALFLVVAVLFIQFNRQYFQAQARYIYPAVAGLAGIFGLGGWQLMAKRDPKYAWIVVGGFLCLLDAAALSQLDGAFKAVIR